MKTKVSFFALSGLTLGLAVGMSLWGSGGCGSSTSTSDMASSGDQASGPVGFTSIFADMTNTCAVSLPSCHAKAGNTTPTTLLIDTSGASTTNYDAVLAFVTKGNGAGSLLVEVPSLEANAPSNNMPHTGGNVLVGAMKTKWIAWINNNAPQSP